MNPDLLLWQNVQPSLEFVNEIFAYNPQNLEATDGRLISKYAIALSQYLIYLKSQINLLRVNVNQRQRLLDSTVNQLLTKDILKEYKTKKDAYEYIVSNSEKLNNTRDELFMLEDQLTLLDGTDKTISELIAVFKRELTRRESEFYLTRKERY